MALDEAARKLSAIPLFANLEPSRLKLLAFTSDRLSFADGEEVCHQGDPADSAYFLESGAVDIVIGEGEERIKVAELHAGDLFGEMALFLHSGRSATVIAHGDLTVMKIDGDMFLKIVTENPEAALGVMKALSEKIVATSEKVAAARKG